MNVFLAVFIFIGIVIVVWGVRAFLIDTKEKGELFSSRAVVIRSSLEATLVMLPVLALVVWLPYRFDFSYKLGPDVSIADGCLTGCYFWTVCVLVFVCLHLARAIDRSKRKKSTSHDDFAEPGDP